MVPFGVPMHNTSRRRRRVLEPFSCSRGLNLSHFIRARGQDGEERVQRGQQGQCGRRAPYGTCPALKLATCPPSPLSLSQPPCPDSVYSHCVLSGSEALNCHCHEVCASWLMTLSRDLRLGVSPGLSPCLCRRSVPCKRNTALN